MGIWKAAVETSEHMSRPTAVIDDFFRGVSEEQAHVLGDFPVGVAMGAVFTLIEPPLTQGFIVSFGAGVQLLIKVDFSVVHELDFSILASASEAPVSQLLHRKGDAPFLHNLPGVENFEDAYPLCIDGGPSFGTSIAWRFFSGASRRPHYNSTEQSSSFMILTVVIVGPCYLKGPSKGLQGG